MAHRYLGPMEAHKDDETRAAWLRERQASGTSSEEALAFFDALPPVKIEEMIGRWKGSGLPTGHPQDGMLEATGWYGKEFLDAETVHPLLFTDGKEVFAVESKNLPIGMMRRPSETAKSITKALFPLVGKLARITEPRARLRMVEHRGQLSVAMIYDYLPINDHFRRVDANTRLGLMDLRGEPKPFFFVLRRER